MLKLSEEQVEKVVSHIAGFTAILAEAVGVPFEMEILKPKPATGLKYEDTLRVLNPEKDISPFSADFPPMEPKPLTIYDYDRDDCRKRIEVMNLLCGRWTPDGNRCDIEIERRGEHFILYYLKRNCTRTGERYALVWSYGDVYYCCAVNRLTMLSLDVATDTLMISPGVDYTRVAEPEK